LLNIVLISQYFEHNLTNLNLAEGFYLGDWLVLPKQNLLRALEKEVYIEPKLMEVLLYLTTSQPEVISADELITNCWPNQVFSDNPVHKCIARLRKALEDDARSPSYIKTIPKKGYAIISQVTMVNPSSKPLNSHWQDGPPYLGFNSYQANHRHILFGRYKATSEIKQKLNQIDANHNVLLIMGAHSVGKTSIIDSQITPYLELPTSKIGNNIGSFIKFTISKDCEIDETNLLLKKLQQDTNFKSSELLSQQEQSTLKHFVFIDQLERIVINRPTEQTDAFLSCLEGLITSENFIIIMALNHEYFAEIMGFKAFQNIKKMAAVYDLLPPDQEELREIITKPVVASDLRFEYDNENFLTLDVCIINDAQNLNLALPVISHTMRELCIHKNNHNELTFACYHRMGGLTGCIAKQFNEIYNAIDPKERTAFENRLHQLIKIDPKQPENLYCAEIDIQNIKHPSIDRLLNELMTANLIAAKMIDGRTYISIVNEALLDQCEVFKNWIAHNRLKLLGLAEIQVLHSQWIKHKKASHYLSNNIDLLQKTDSFILTESETHFVSQSKQKYNKNRYLKIGSIIGLVCMLLISLTLLIKLNLNVKELSTTKNKAEALNVFLMKDLKEELIPIGRLDLLEMISQQIIQYYALLPEKSFTVSSYNHLINALNTIGQVKIRSGELDHAMSLLVESDGYVKKSLLLNASDTQTLFQSSQNQYWKGYIHYLKKEWPVTEVYWSKYLQLTIQMEQLEPENLNWQLEHSYALNNLGTISLNLKQNEMAQKYLNKSEQIKERLVDKAPNNSQYVAELADTISWLAKLLGDENKLVEANNYHRKSLVLSKRLIEIDPHNSNWDYRLALAYYRLGSSDYDLGDLQAAGLNISQSISIMDELFLIDENNHKWLRTFINNHIVMAKLNRYKGMIDQALWHIEQGKFYYHKYSAQNKQLIREANQLLKLNTVSSLIMNDLGQTKAALTQYQKAYDYFQQNSNTDQIPAFTRAYNYYILNELSQSDGDQFNSNSLLEMARKALLLEINKGSKNKEIKALYLMITTPDPTNELLSRISAEIKDMQYKNPDLLTQEKKE